MASLKHTLEAFLQDTRVLIGNSQTLPEVSGALEDFGYTEDRMAEGRTLLRETEALILKQKKEYGDQYEATEAAQAAWDKADTAYMKTLKIARLVFSEDIQAITALKLTGSRKATMAGWMDQAVSFYGNLTAQPPLVAAMARFGYTTEKLLAEKALVDAVALPQEATADRDAAVRRLDTWVGELRTVLKVALAEDPETLEAVGIKGGAAGRPKKKALKV